MSEKTRQLLVEKERAHVQLAPKSVEEFAKTDELPDTIQRLAYETARSLADDENGNLEKLAGQLEEADRKHNPRNTWKIIRTIAGKKVKRTIKAKYEK